MAQDTTVPKLNFEYWLDKAVEWGQTTTLQSQQDVCLHLPKLQEFLQQIYETLKHMNSVAAIQRFPLIGQLLGRLCWNPFVIGYDESQKTLIWCLCCLYSSEPQSPVELKANSWIRGSELLGENMSNSNIKLTLLCHLLSSSPWGSKEADTSNFISVLGYTSEDYYEKLVENMVLSLVTELRGNRLNGFNIQGRISADRVYTVSLFCVPLITLPDLTPLLEALLTHHGSKSQEVLSSEFLEAVNEAFLRKKIALSESAVFSLWLRHLPSLEKATLDLLERLISNQTTSLEEVVCIIKDSLLPKASCYPAIFRIVDDILKNAVLETDGAPEVMLIISVFTQCFVQAHQNDNKQHKFPLKTYFPHRHQPLVIALLKHPFDLPATFWSQHLKHISDMLKAEVEDETIRSYADLFETWYLFVHFGEWIDIAAEQVLKSGAKSSDALLWLLAFYYNPYNENHQRIQTMVETRAVCDHLKMLFSHTTLSITDLEAAASRMTDTTQLCTEHLIRHLFITFLLFSSGGHKIAREFVSHITEARDATHDIFASLIRTAYRLNHFGEKNQRTIKLVNELLQGLTFKI